MTTSIRDDARKRPETLRIEGDWMLPDATTSKISSVYADVCFAWIPNRTLARFPKSLTALVKRPSNLPQPSTLSAESGDGVQ